MVTCTSTHVRYSAQGGFDWWFINKYSCMFVQSKEAFRINQAKTNGTKYYGIFICCKKEEEKVLSNT